MKKMKIKLAILASLAVVSCSMPVNQQTTTIDNFTSSQNTTSIRGQVNFPETKPEFVTKATIGEIGNKSVVSLLLPPDHPSTPNKTMATGLTDASGNFTINVGFTPALNQIYILEAAKRIGAPGTQVISLRSYLKWNGSSWLGITTPTININSKTTAITIIDYYDNSIGPNDTIGTIVDGTLGNIGTVTTSLINELANQVSFTFGLDRDPVLFIGYNSGDYFIRKEPLHNKSYLLANKHCPNCDLKRQNFSTLDLAGANLKSANLSRVNFSGTNLNGANFTSANLSNANLSGANLSGGNLTNVNLNNSNLSGSNLSGATLTGATITSADFSGATWTNGSTLCATGSIGTCIFPDILVNTFTDNNQGHPVIALDALGDFVVVWQSYGQDGSGDGIYAQRYTSTGSVNGSEFMVNSGTYGYQSDPGVAMDADGDFVISYTLKPCESFSCNYSSEDIYAQRYNSSGEVVGSEFRVNSDSNGNQFNSSVAMDADGDFVITYTSKPCSGFSCYFGSYSNDVYAQRYTSTGFPTGSEFRVNSTDGLMDQSNSIVAMAAAGDFVVVWDSYGQDGSTNGIYAQRYTSDGAVSGSEFLVNTYTNGQQRVPRVAMDVDGDFVVTWISQGQDGNSYGIYAQRYTSDGSVAGSEFKVNSYTTGAQMYPTVAMDGIGNFVISWQSNNQDGSGYGIYAQRYTSTGTLSGSEFRVNTFTNNTQKDSQVAMDGIGNFLITWDSSNQDGSSSGVYLKRYDSNGGNQ